MKNQQGYLLIIAVFFIMVIAVMGNLIAYIFAARAPVSAAQYKGFSALYIAESGLEIASRLLSQPTVINRVACGAITGDSQVTNASYGDGTLTVIASGGAPVFSFTALSNSVSRSADVIDVSSTSGFADSGWLVVDREILTYSGIAGNSFINVQRGAAGSTASAHAFGVNVSQYQCDISSSSGIPSITAPSAQRNVQWQVQLQNLWVAADRQGNSIQHFNWNQLTELDWQSSDISANRNTRANLNAISMLSGADGWAAGDEANNNFTLTHWNGSNWSLVNVADACENQHLYGISMVSAGEGWAVGARHEEGCGDGGQGGGQGQGKGKGQGGGQGGGGSASYRYTIMQGNGGSWSILTPGSSPSIPADDPGNQDLNAVHVIDSNQDGVGDVGFAVGNQGTILQYNGVNWSSVGSPTSENLKGVYVVSGSEAWAVGENGTILVWNGTSWGMVSSPTSSDLNAVTMLDSSFGLAVGENGSIIQYNGASWSAVSSGSGADLYGVAIFTTKDAWAVGVNGTALHWNGSIWSSSVTKTGATLNGISAIHYANRPVYGWQETFR